MYSYFFIDKEIDDENQTCINAKPFKGERL